MSSQSTNALSPKDRKLLAAALASGHTFEKTFNAENETEFRTKLSECADGDSILVRKLSELAPKVSLSLGPKHLMALLVPLERLAGRSARDDEFLYFDTDSRYHLPFDSRYHLPFAENATNLHGLKTYEFQRIVLCENMRSAFNVGSVYRTTECFGGSAVWLTGYSPDPTKTAMGTDEMIQTRRFDRTEDAVSEARKQGYKIVALENSPGATALDEFQWPEKTVLILGNERFGVDSQTLAACDAIVRIATRGHKNSLNVGTAFGIAAATWNKTAASWNHTASPSRAETATDVAIKMSPIGYLRGGFEHPQAAPRQGAYALPASELTASLAAPSATATIELEARFQGRPSNFEQALKDLDGFDRAWIVFGFDRSDGWNPQVRPPRGDGIKRGLFATRSPHRPNRVGISCVKIVSVSGRKIEIAEHDLLDGSPIFDIKPYIPDADAFLDAKAGWVDEITESEFQLLESEQFQRRREWLEENGDVRIGTFASEQLRFQPFDDSRKRITLSDDESDPTHSIAFRTWRIDFRQISEAQLELVNIRSGYSELELRDALDPYGDKKLHRKFQEVFHAAVF